MSQPEPIVVEPLVAAQQQSHQLELPQSQQSSDPIVVNSNHSNHNQHGSSGSSSNISSASDGDSSLEEHDGNNSADSPLAAAPDDDTVYGNKQLIAHLLGSVCSSYHHHNQLNGQQQQQSQSNQPQQQQQQQHHQPAAATSTSSSARLNNNGVGSIGIGSGSSSRNRSRRVRSSNSDSSRSRSPPDEDTVDGAAAASAALSASSGYLTASSASGMSLSAPSASPAYVSPFALSPLSEASPWCQPAISLAVLKDRRTAELERVLRQLCREFESRLHDRFDNFSGHLDTEPATIRESVNRELETLFYDDNIHWGRIIAVFVLAKEICDKCLAENRPQLAAAVQQWVAEFIDHNLWDWVRQNHGWYGLIKFYRDTGGQQEQQQQADDDRPWSQLLSIGTDSRWHHPIASLLALTAASIAVALVAAYFRR